MSDDEGSHSLPRLLANSSLQLLPSPPTTNGGDITRYLKFKLDATSGNYNKWRQFFLIALSKYNARHHVEEETDPHLADDAWRAADADIVLWIYTTISDELQDIILDPDCTAYSAWQALKHFFTENAEGREIHLDKAFSNAVQGDMDVVAYCRKLKGIAEQLGDVGAPVTDKKLTMRLIAGLDDRFKMQQEILETMKPFPSFMQAQSRLQLAEEKLKEKAAAAPQILHTANANTGSTNYGNGAPPFRFFGNCYSCGEQGHMARYCPRGGDRAPSGQPGRGGGQFQQGRGGGGQHQYGYTNYHNGSTQGYGRGGGRGRGRGRGDHGGRGGYNPHYGHSQYQQQPPQPYGGARAATWVPPNSASILGPSPGSHGHVYTLMSPSPTQHNGPTPPPTTSDYNTMFHTAPSNSTGFPPGGNWVMDSGATTHVTNTPGSSNETNPHALQ